MIRADKSCFAYSFHRDIVKSLRIFYAESAIRRTDKIIPAPIGKFQRAVVQNQRSMRRQKNRPVQQVKISPVLADALTEFHHAVKSAVCNQPFNVFVIRNMFHFVLQKYIFTVFQKFFPIHSFSASLALKELHKVPISVA